MRHGLLALCFWACVGTESDTVEPSESDEPPPIAAATQDTLLVPLTLEATGAGDDRLAGLAIAEAVGPLTLDGVPHDGIVYQRHDWGATGFVLYDVLSVAEDGSDLAVTYLYCDGSSLDYAYTESFTLPMGYETASGTCDGTAGDTEAEVNLPALKATPEHFATGITITGADVFLDDAGGALWLEGVERELVPFNTVDCTDCPGGPWYEIHSLLLGDEEACFTILYLFPAEPETMDVAYSLCLPTLEQPSATLDVTWSGDIATRARSMPWRPLPPGR